MQENDARRLDHHTLEALRERAVRKVQEGAPDIPDRRSRPGASREEDQGVR
jgi:hypothetical protein